MKLFKRLLVIVGISVAASGLVAGVAHAAGADQVVGGTVNHSLYKVGSSVTITGTVNGDVFCLAQTVTIDATVNGDVLCAGQTITVDGTVNGSVRLAGQSVHIGAAVMHGASAVGQDITLTSAARIGEDASFAGQTVTVDGTVGRDVAGAGNRLVLNGVVGGDVTSRANRLVLEDGAQVAGGVTYTSAHLMQRSGSAVVGGTVTHHPYVAHRSGHGFILIKMLWLAAMCVLAVVLVALCPRAFRRLNPAWGAPFWWAALTGFVAMFALPVAIVTLLATVVGAPLGLLLLLLWAIIALVSMPFAAYFGGKLIAPKLHPVWVVLIGSVVLALIELIPVAGWIIGLFAYWLGSGTLLIGIKRHYPLLSRGSKTERTA